ncbi:MAG: hypothetical protein NC098_07235 [Lachnoclostridium sp.]|nr:hypothetical protein [Lachnoclostridium sp.]
MKNHMLISVFAVALLSASADAQLLKPESLIPVPKNQLISTFSSPEIKQTPQKIKAGAPDTSDWKVAEGDWQYKSGYTGKTYPTEVRYKYNISSEGDETNAVEIELKNALFGTAYISQNEAGDFNSLFTYDEDNFITNVDVLDETGNPSGLTLASSVVNVKDIPGVYRNWSQYPLSGKAHFSSFYMAKSDVFISPKAYYDDWLYNTKAKDCKITTEYARGYYHGETSVKVKLTRGEGVTDVYYIICLKERDEQRAAKLEEQGVDVSYSYVGVRREYVSEYISEFKAGKTNEAYRVGHIDDNASEFDIPLDGINGVRELFIVALNGEKITDMESDVIEVRDLSGWSHYATVTFDSYIYFNGNNTGDNLLKSGIMNIEKNADGTVLRIVNPYKSGDNPERNYIYLNTSFGLDKCYFETSLTPIEYEYHYKDINDKDITIKRNLVYQDFVSLNLSLGFSPEGLISTYKELFTDISHGYTYISIMALNYNNWLDFKIYGETIVGESYFGGLSMTFDNFVKYSIDYNRVSFEVDPKIEYLDCTFDSDGKIYRVSTSDDSGYINIYQLLRDGQLKENPKVLHYTAYSANNEVLRTASLDLNDIDFTDEMADITFSNYYPDDVKNYFIDSALHIHREYDVDTQVYTYLVNDLGKAFTLYMGDSSLKLEVKNNLLNSEPNRVYCGMYDFGNAGNLDVFLVFYNVSYEMNSDGTATFSGLAQYEAYDYNENFIGYVDRCYFELIIPEKLTRDPAGIDEIISDEIDDKAIYYNIQGQRVEYPSKGSVVIEVKGGKARKIAVR